MQFTKLFNSILDSTIWQEPLETKVVWITMLAMSDRNGELFASVPGLAKRAGVTIGQCEAAIDCLSSPDTYSRTKAHEGRRIEEIDGGWALLNHAKYRALLSSDERKEYNRRKQAEYREVKKMSNLSTNVKLSEQCQHIQSTEAEAEAEADTIKNNNRIFQKTSFQMPSIDDFVTHYEREMKQFNRGEHLPVADWLIEQHSYCADRWEVKPPNNWKSHTGRFATIYRKHWENTKPHEGGF